MKKIAIFLLILCIIPFVSSLEKSYLCDKIYLSIQKDIPNQNLIQEIKYEKGEDVDDGVIGYYKTNWERVCSSEVKKTLNAKSLCSDIYYLIISTDYGYSNSDLSKISSKNNVSVEIAENYINDNYNLCFLMGYSNQLPAQKFQKLVVENNTKCDLNKSSFMDISIPLEIQVGEADCESIQLINNFFRYEEFNGYYTFKGVRLYVIGILGIIILLFVMIHAFIKSNKEIEKILD